MNNLNHPRYKLTTTEIESAKSLFEDNGWKIIWLCMHFNVDHKSIRFHMHTNGWVRKVGVATVMPEEIAAIYRQMRRDKYLEKMKGTYEFIHASARQKRLENCEHARWIKRCSLCGEILASDSIDHHLIGQCTPRSELPANNL